MYDLIDEYYGSANPGTASVAAVDNSMVDQFANELYPPATPATPAVYNEPVNPVVSSQPVTTPAATSTSNSVSVGNTGFSSEKFDQIAGKDTVGKKAAARMKPFIDQTNEQLVASDAIANQRVDVANRVGDINEKKAVIQAEYDAENARAINEHNNNVMAAEERGMQRIEGALATHNKMVQDYMAMSVDPGALYKRMTTAEKAGSSLAVAVSAFLGAKGIETPIMGILDKAIERSIDAQIQNINKAGKAVDMQNDVIAQIRAQSRSDVEAKMRAKDAALESLKGGLVSEMSKFGSELANARTQEIIADIQERQLANREALRKEITQQENIVTGQEISKYNAQVAASAENRRVALAEKQFAAEQEEKARLGRGKELESLAKDVVWDTSEGADNFGLLFKPGLTDKEKEDTRTILAQKSATLSVLKEAIELSKKVGKRYRGPWSKFIDDPNVAKLNQLNIRLVSDIRKHFTGLSGSDKELENAEKQLPLDSLLTAEKYNQVAGQMSGIIRNEVNHMLSQRTRDLPPDVRDMLIQSGYGKPTMPQDVIGKDRIGEGGYGEAVGTVGEAYVDNKPAPKPTETQKAFDRISTVKSGELTNPSKAVGTVFTRYTEYAADTAPGYEKYYTLKKFKRRPTVAQESIIKLGLNARGGDKQALDYLTKIASEPSGLLNEYSGITDKASFAQWVLKDLQLVPDDVIQQYVDNEGGLDDVIQKYIDNEGGLDAR